MRVVKKVANEAELVACVARNGDTDVELSLADPTLGSLLLFCQGRQHKREAVLRHAPGPRESRSRSQADKELEGGLQLTSCLLRCCTKSTKMASAIAVSSLATNAHRRWSEMAAALGSADVLDFIMFL